MPDLTDAVDPTEGNPGTGAGVTAVGRAAVYRHNIVEHICWFASRAALLSFIAVVMIWFNIPLQSLIEGNALKQLQSERQKAGLEETQMLREVQRQVSEMTVALSALQKIPSSGEKPGGSELERAVQTQ